MESLELRRQLFHIAIGVVFVTLLHFGVLDWLGEMVPLPFLRYSARALFMLLAIVTILFLLYRKYRIPLVHWFIVNFERQEKIEIFPGKGAFFGLLGIFIVVTIFGPPITMASILILALGDSVSNLVGKKAGRTKHPLSNTKFLEGTIAGTLLGAAGASLFVHPLWALVAASLAMFVEGIDLGRDRYWMIDDNLLVPLTAGVILFIIT
ncbi:hypothetical protein AKJ43_02870 [candidate division MSBL1 archaeon SCGC-AAA261D19]|uniref:Phosphatidate cytidylyltransferase n=1 Tax=candidate division MSBL1 archaeon SCGC-AAA261D19 TaxID=1698273 RepID=A0A133V639_9EURY|nr:hypothetical protein AKJ43_02870 [candidate division MSBL1 archaeon SCGC-AAA261D19]